MLFLLFSSLLRVVYCTEEQSAEKDLNTPPVPPRRKERRRHTPPRPMSNGLPPTPKVHMGACFSKVRTLIRIS